MNSSEVLLNNAERYGLLVASSVNGSAGDDQSAVRQSRSNIGTCNTIIGRSISLPRPVGGGMQGGALAPLF